jgi:hypothetical protein
MVGSNGASSIYASVITRTENDFCPTLACHIERTLRGDRLRAARMLNRDAAAAVVVLPSCLLVESRHMHCVDFHLLHCELLFSCECVLIAFESVRRRRRVRSVDLELIRAAAADRIIADITVSRMTGSIIPAE